MKSCHPRETGNIGYTRRRQTKHNTEKLATQGTQDEDKQTHNTIGIGHHYLGKKATNNVNKT